MDYRRHFHPAQVEPLTGWSIGGSLMELGIAIWQAVCVGVARSPLILPVICTILLQYAAHPLNDLIDRDFDAAAKSPETGRVKPPVAGTAAEAELKALSAALILIAAFRGRVDAVCRTYLRGTEAPFEAKCGRIRPLQRYASIFCSVTLLTICAGVRPHG